MEEPIEDRLAGVHRTASLTKSQPVELNLITSGRGGSEHSEDSSAGRLGKPEPQFSVSLAKNIGSEAEMKVLEDVSLSEEEERASSGSPQMIDCPAIESPAPSHTSQVSAGSGIEAEPHEGQEDDGREKHENEGEKEIPIDAALVTELSCDTIESSSMPLSPLLEKKVSESVLASRANFSSV